MSRRPGRGGGFLSWWLGELDPAPPPRGSRHAGTRRAGSPLPRRARAAASGDPGPATRKASRGPTPRITTTSGAERRRIASGRITLSEAIGLGLIEGAGPHKGKTGKQPRSRKK
jgi:hypothetical protein